MATKTKDINFNINDFSADSEIVNAKSKSAVYIDGITQEDVANLKMSIIDKCLVITDGND